MPVHWRTFIQSPPSREPVWEPLLRLKAAAGSQTNRIVCEEPGSVFVLPESAAPVRNGTGGTDLGGR